MRMFGIDIAKRYFWLSRLHTPGTSGSQYFLSGMQCNIMQMNCTQLSALELRLRWASHPYHRRSPEHSKDRHNHNFPFDVERCKGPVVQREDRELDRHDGYRVRKFCDEPAKMEIVIGFWSEDIDMSAQAMIYHCDQSVLFDILDVRRLTDQVIDDHDNTCKLHQSATKTSRHRPSRVPVPERSGNHQACIRPSSSIGTRVSQGLPQSQGKEGRLLLPECWAGAFAPGIPC